ncbi:hypothetical protein Lal_00025801 [Lupinus albus]|nr:hypothetical protein Lal_00025801 [Lupinus albus]
MSTIGIKEQDLKNNVTSNKVSQPKIETKASVTPTTNKNSKDQVLKKKISDDKPISYIRWKGFEETTTTSCKNCALCGKDMAYLSSEEKLENSNHEENEVGYSIFPSEEEEMAHIKYSILPEASILPCSHVFHSYCLLNTSIELSDPSCPICLGLL